MWFGLPGVRAKRGAAPLRQAGPENLRKITHCAGWDVTNTQSDQHVTGKVTGKV
jgi:hypothetical protein